RASNPAMNGTTIHGITCHNTSWDQTSFGKPWSALKYNGKAYSSMLANRKLVSATRITTGKRAVPARDESCGSDSLVMSDALRPELRRSMDLDSARTVVDRERANGPQGAPP